MKIVSWNCNGPLRKNWSSCVPLTLTFTLLKSAKTLRALMIMIIVIGQITLFGFVKIKIKV